MTEYQRMLFGKLYDPIGINDGVWERGRQVLETFNSLPLQEQDRGMELLRGLLGRLPEDATIIPPFYCDRGPQISIGKHFFANTGLLILDHANVDIGNNVIIGPRVSIYTTGRPIDPQVRCSDLEISKGVHIGSDVWIGGNVVINPGVSIGKGSVIGSGSVVTHDIPANVIAAGNPCQVIREITDEDREYWQKQEEEYHKQMG